MEFHEAFSAWADAHRAAQAAEMTFFRQAVHGQPDDLQRRHAAQLRLDASEKLRNLVSFSARVARACSAR